MGALITVSGERGTSGGTASLRAWALALGLVFPLTAHRSPLAAQQTAFELFRDSLTATTDTTALRSMLQPLRRSDPVRAGLIGLRLGELHADSDFSESLSSFRRASRIDPSQPEPWFGLGLAESGRSESEMRNPLNLGSRVGLRALERSAANHARALRSDPRFLPAVLALAQVELALMDTARLTTARGALRRAAQAWIVKPPELLLALGRVERAAGLLDSAVAAFEGYLFAGGSRGLGRLELGRTQLALGRAEGEAPYYEGAALDEPVATAGYRADLQLLASDSVIREFDLLQGQARAAFLHRFWTDRDRLELRQEGERLREHYRRLQFARQHFPLTISRRFYGRLDAYRSGNTELDDRGVIYIRHGKPAQRLRPFIFGAMPNESWRYVQAEGDLLLHFSGGYDGNGGGDLYDYRLVGSVLDLRGAAEAPRDQLLLSRQTLSPMYGRMLNWGRYGAAKARALERSIGSASIAVGTTTDTHELVFRDRLPVVADLIAVGRSAAGSLAHLVFGIAASGTSPDGVGPGATYRVRVRLVALDQHDRPLTSLDTTLVISHPHPLDAEEFLVGRAELTLPPGKWRYRASLQQGDSAGVVLPRQSVMVAAMDGPSLALSDIALGSRGRAVPWVTDAADTVLLAPSGLFRKGSDMELYYEASGAKPGSWYRHEITVLRGGKPESKSKQPLVALSFEEVAADSVIRSRRVVRLERLKEGSYSVEVKITAPDGTSRTRQRPFRIIKA